jgi:polyisoprenoid-binding protein YceI
MESRWDGDCSLPNFMDAINRRDYVLQQSFGFVVFVLLTASVPAFAQQATLQVDPAQTVVKFTLGDVLHTVHGSFRLKQGSLQLDEGSGKLTGEIVVDAKSGDSGSKMRDGKMHREVLESEQYAEIKFRPDRIEGSVNPRGKSTVKVRGIFTIHGVDREIAVPAEADLEADHWTATLHFTIPYVKWGMKNPSALFLRVDDSVQIDVVAAGSLSSR